MRKAQSLFLCAAMFASAAACDVGDEAIHQRPAATIPPAAPVIPLPPNPGARMPTPHRAPTAPMRTLDDNQLVQGLPDDLKSIYSVAKDAAEIFSTFSTWGQIVNGLTTIFDGSKPDPVMEKLSNIDSKLNEIYNEIDYAEWTTRNQIIQSQGVAPTLNGHLDALAWAKAHPDGTPMSEDDDKNSASRLGIAVLLQPANWYRPIKTYKDWHAFLPQSVPSDSAAGPGQVWDYRIVLPALVTATNFRFHLMAVIDPSFARDAHFRDELGLVQGTLRDAYERMKGGIACAGGYDVRPGLDAAGRSVWQFQYYAACGDPYTGAMADEAIGPILIFDTWSPEQNSTPPPANFFAPPPSDQIEPSLKSIRKHLESAMGLSGLAQFIDTVSWYSHPWKPLYNNRRLLGVDTSSASITTGNATGWDDQLWSFDPSLGPKGSKLGRIRSGSGWCIARDALGLRASTCDWTDPAYNVYLDGPPERLHLVNGNCLDVSGLEIAQQALAMQESPCDMRRTESVSWSKLWEGSGNAAPMAPERMDVVDVDALGRVRTTFLDAALSSEWKRGPDLPDGNLPGSAPVTLIARFESQLDAFAVDKNGTLVSTWRNDLIDGGVWHPWFPVSTPGTFVAGTALAAISLDTDTMHVFGIGQDGGVWNAWWNRAQSNNWNNAFRITGTDATLRGGGCGIAAIARDRWSMDVFYVNANGGLVALPWNAAQNNAQWSVDASRIVIPNGMLPAGGQVAVTARTPRHMDVFAVGVDGAIHSSWWDLDINGGQWNTPFLATAATVALPGASVAAVARTDQHLDVYAIAANGSVVSNWWDGAPGMNWDKHPTFTLMPPRTNAAGAMLGALTRYPSHQDVFATSPNGAIQTAWWDDADPQFKGPMALPVHYPHVGSVIASNGLTVNFQDMPGTPKDWIAVTYYPKSPAFSNYGYAYTGGAISGTVSLPDLHLADGTYVVRAFVNDTNTIVGESEPFSIGSPPEPKVTIHCSDDPCKRTSAITATYANLPTVPNINIALAPSWVSPNGYANSISLHGQANGTVTFTKFAGDEPLIARVYDWTTPLLDSNDSIVAIGSHPAVSADCASGCAPGAPVVASFTDLPGYQLDWIAAIPVDKSDRDYVAYAFTNGQVTGTVTVGTLPPGTYVLKAFENTGWTVKATSAPFVIGTP